MTWDRRGALLYGRPRGKRIRSLEATWRRWFAALRASVRRVGGLDEWRLAQRDGFDTLWVGVQCRRLHTAVSDRYPSDLGRPVGAVSPQCECHSNGTFIYGGSLLQCKSLNRFKFTTG